MNDMEYVIAINKRRKLHFRLVLVLVCLVPLLMVMGCASDGLRVSDHWGSRWFYKCDIPQSWINKVNDTYGIQVLPFKEFNKVAWGHRVSPETTRAFIQGTSIWLREDYSLDNYYHELGHSYENFKGNYGHGPTCWQTGKPWGYDDKVLAAFEGLELP